MVDVLTDEVAEQVMSSWPESFVDRNPARGLQGVRSVGRITSWGPLSATHAAIAAEHIESRTPIGVKVPELKTIRITHHRLAMLVASGMSDTIAGRLCNFSPQRVYFLRQTPAFAELVAHYKAEVDVKFAEFAETAQALSMDMLGRLQELLDEHPEMFTPQVALKAIEVLADRSGNAPVNRSVNLNVTANMGERLARARERANGELIEGQARMAEG